MQEGVTAARTAAGRFDWFADTVSNALMPSAFTARDEAGFYAEGSLLDLGAVQVSKFRYSPLHSRRTAALIRRGDPEQYQVGLVAHGTAWYAQNSSEAHLGAGDMVLWDTSRPYESVSGVDGSDVEVYVLQIPKTRMPLPSQQIDRILSRRLPAGSGLGAVFGRFLSSVADSGPDCRPEELEGLGSMALDLAASFLSRHLGLRQATPATTRAHVLRRQIDAFIERNLPDPALTPRMIADHHHISLRSLYALFQQEAVGEPGAEGVAAAIRRRRLERCRADLERADFQRHPVHAVAARWGFHHAAAFSRAFRTAYGTTPTSYRAQALGRMPTQRTAASPVFGRGGGTAT